MKKLNILFYLSFFLLIGCLEDEGNYDYKSLNEPKWYADPIAQPIAIYGKEGEVMEFRGHKAFKWETDSAQREKEVRYEWRIKNVLIGEEADFDIKVDSVVKKVNLTEFLAENKSLPGTFTVIDKETGTRFMSKVIYFITATRGSGDWFVLAEDGGNAKCYYIDRYVDKQTNKTIFEIKDTYDKANGENIPGKPLFLAYTRTAKNIGPLGSGTIITDKVAYEFRPENFLKVAELKDQFGNGTPADFKPVARVDAWENDAKVGRTTFVTTEDGRLFRRQLSNNNLGGAFMTTPYFLDEKGYKITKFGRKQYGLRSSFPCYDEKHNRVIMVIFADKQPEGSMPWDPAYSTSKLIPVRYSSTVSQCPPVWNMPQGTKMLDIGYAGFEGGWMGVPPIYRYSLLYNLNGKTYYGECGANGNTGELVQATAGWGPFPGTLLSKLIECSVKVPDDSFVLSGTLSETPMIIYSNGNAVNYIDKDREYMNFPLISDFGEKVTFVGRDGNFQVLVVGGINGKLAFYSIVDRDDPKLLKTEQLSGRVVSAKEITSKVSGSEY